MKWFSSLYDWLVPISLSARIQQSIYNKEFYSLARGLEGQ